MSSDFVPMNLLLSRKLPLNSADFEVLRSSEQIYVDKAQAVLNISVFNSSFLFTRPRFFGKTLLISTFASLFEHGFKYFEGLKIDKQYRKFWENEKTYKVLRLDLSLCSVFSDVKEFLTAFENQLSNALIRIGMKLSEKGENDTLISRFDRLLNGLDDASLVLLIDEYDAPLNHCLDNEQLFSEVRNELYSFYLDVKNQSPKMRFVFMTGVNNYKNFEIFSGANHVIDLSLMSDYGTLLGYTKEEIEEYFSPFVENAAKVLNISYEACLNKMATYYDGYCFDSNASTHVFTPRSVLNFLKYPQNEFDNYWYESSRLPSVLINYIKKHSLCTPDAYGREQSISIVELDSSSDSGEVNDLALLFQIGYLSIKKAMPKDKVVVLNYPNSKVANSMARIYVDKFVKGKSWLNLYTEFMEHTPEQIVDFLNNNLLATTYVVYPVENESVLRAILGFCIKSSGLEARFEESNACGRSDLEVRAGKRYFVIELKYASEEDQTDQLLAQAEAQITARHYGEQNGQGVIHVYMALVFSGKERRFVKYSVRIEE